MSKQQGKYINCGLLHKTEVLTRNSPGILDSTLVTRICQHPSYSIFLFLSSMTQHLWVWAQLSTGVTQSSVTTLMQKLGNGNQRESWHSKAESRSHKGMKLRCGNPASPSLELCDTISLYWEDNQPAPGITNSTAQHFMVSLELSVKSQEHIHTHTCRHACTSSLQLYSKQTHPMLEIINCKHANLTGNQENAVKLL